MMERPTTITAEQFIDQDYDDIVFDHQAVVTFGDLKVIDITPRTDEFVMLWVYSERIGFDKVKVLKGEVLGVRWLDTAQTERDAEAGDAPSVNVFAAYVGELEATVASLQAELAATRKQLAAAERVAALETVYEAVVQCDMQGDMLDAYKAPYDETVHTANINFNALLEWADLSNALDYLRDKEATPQPAPASELVAAVKPFADAIEHAEGLSDEATVISDMLHDDYHIGMITLGDIRTLVNAAAALKGEENTK